MKIELIRKVMVVGLALLMGIAVCVSVWFFLSEHKARELQEQSRPPRPNNKIAADNPPPRQPSQTPAGNADEEPLTRKERAFQQAKSYFMSSLSEARLATPFARKMLEAMDSPEYFALLERGFTERQWNDFMESKGVPVIRGHSGLFRKVLPIVELTDYEPVVRRKLAELFVAAEPVDLTTPVAAALQRAQVLGELAETDKASLAWFLENFGEDWDVAILGGEGMESNSAVIWMDNVQRNAASIVAAAETAGVNALETQGSVPSWDLSSVMESTSVSHNETEVPTTLDTSERAPMTDAEIEAAIEKLLPPQPPDILTNQRPDPPGQIPSNLETTLKAQFSSERFEWAMSTLEQYGPEEGLRRLRESDPEVAQQVQNHRNSVEVSQ